MGWQNLLISRPAALRVDHSNLLCEQQDAVLRLPLTDIATITIESHRITLTAALLATLNERGVVLITCDDRHMPNGMMLACNTHSRSLEVLQRQIGWTLPFRKRAWQRIIRRKIDNQAAALELFGGDAASLRTLSSVVLSGDTTNREALAARRYFGQMFDDFRRGADDKINAALNYGYAIVRAAIARDLVRFGFHPALGLHHANQLNAFNLADDLLEPFRPFVDGWARQSISDPSEAARLSKEERGILTQVLQVGCEYAGERHRLLHAILLCVRSLSSAVGAGDWQALQLPELRKPLALVPID